MQELAFWPDWAQQIAQLREGLTANKSSFESLVVVSFSPIAGHRRTAGERPQPLKAAGQRSKNASN
jgi:hypothetical protein